MSGEERCAMKGTMFKKGFKAVREEEARREKLKEMRKGRLWRFFIGKDDPEDIPIRFLTEEPICYYEHTVQEGGKFANIPCIGDGCEYCDSKKPSYAAAWLVVDGREFSVDEKDANGNKTGKKKTVKDRIKVLVRGITTAGQLERLSRKYGLMGRMYYVTRTGSGTDTVWNFDRGDNDELTDKQTKALFAQLPEEIRNLDPYEILERQIHMEMDFARGGETSNENSDDDDDESAEDVKAAVKSKVQKIKNDDDDEDGDDEEPTPPKKAPRTLPKKLGKK
jgi:hypothetical protein